MKIDLRRPILVFLGAWNPAIFEPGWIAANIFQVPVGQDTIFDLVLEAPPEGGTVHYLNNIGVSANAQRLRIFANNLEPTSLAKAENVALTILRSLPHTPLGPFGINFVFAESDLSGELIDKLKTSDHIEAKFEMIRQKYLAAIKLENGVTLNFTRQVDRSQIDFEFNFHFPSIDVNEAQQTLVGILTTHLDKAKEIMRDLYGLELEGVITHVFPSPTQG